MKKQSGDVLGRGLGSLLGDMPDFVDENSLSRDIPIELIDNDPDQPRRSFDDKSLEELAQSIRTHGIMQPLILMRTGDRYRIIAGERRYRAARLAELKLIPAIIRDVDRQNALELALIENLQREDLNPMEQAAALNRLVEEHNLTQAQAAERVGMSRSTVANLIRLLNLPEDVAELVANGRLSAGHAKALMSLGDRNAISAAAKSAADNGLSVRDTEALVEGAREESTADVPVQVQAGTARKKKRSPFAEAQAQLSDALGAKVRIAGTEQKGRITIEYVSKEQLESFFEHLRNMGSEV